jgi:hypothetical protein
MRCLLQGSYNSNPFLWSLKRKLTIYIEEDIDKQMRVAAVEDDKFYGEYTEEAFRLFLDTY